MTYDDLKDVDGLADPAVRSVASPEFRQHTWTTALSSGSRAVGPVSSARWQLVIMKCNEDSDAVLKRFAFMCSW